MNEGEKSASELFEAHGDSAMIFDLHELTRFAPIKPAEPVTRMVLLSKLMFGVSIDISPVYIFLPINRFAPTFFTAVSTSRRYRRVLTAATESTATNPTFTARTSHAV